MQKRILLAGDYTNPTWHPFSTVDGEIASACAPYAEVTRTEHHESYALEELCAFDTVAFYLDRWSDKAGTYPWITANLLTYVARGGRLIVLHNPAISETDELAQLLGARFSMHPPCQTVCYEPAETVHPVLRGVEAFELCDEAYHFIVSPLVQRETLLYMTYAGQRLPAMWTLEFGLGTVAYLAPGHTQESYRHPMMQKLLGNLFAWVLQIPQGQDAGQGETI